MTKRHSIRRIVPQKMEDAAKAYNGFLASSHFLEAYAELRRIAPKGDLHIYLTIDEKKS